MSLMLTKDNDMLFGNIGMVLYDSPMTEWINLMIFFNGQLEHGRNNKQLPHLNILNDT